MVAEDRTTLGHSMIKSVRLHNFQGHRNTEVQFGEGINLIRGANALGKSAIARSIAWCLFCEGGADFTTWDEKECGMSVQFDTGVRVTRLRTPSMSRYVLAHNGDKQEYDKHGVNVPEEIISATSLFPVTVEEGVDKIINYAAQGERPFLLYDSASSIERQLGTLIGTHELEQGAKNAKLDLDRTKRSLKEKEESCDSAAQQLEQYIWVEEAHKMMAELQELESAILTTETRVENLQSISTELASLETVGQQLPALESALEEAVAVIAEIDDNVQRTKQLTELLCTMQESDRETQRLAFAIETGQADKEETVDEYNKLLQESGYCPLCGAAIKECEH
jgi:exonuclease SbcC